MSATTLDPLAIPATGTGLIEASAGTGKTYAITTLYLRLLLEGQARTPPLDVRQILVVTFTEAATAELRLRIRTRLREAERALAEGRTTGQPDTDRLLAMRTAARAADRAALLAALQDFDEAAICTIHGFCLRVLRDHAFESGRPLDVALLPDESALLDDVVRDFWVREMADVPDMVVHRAEAEKLGLRTLEVIARRLLAHRRIRVLPATAEDATPDLRAALGRCLAVRDEVARLWARDRASILDDLCSGALNRNVYRPESVRGRWAPALDEHLRQSGTFLSDEEFFPKLTPTVLAKKTNAGRTAPSHAFFDACAALAAAEDAVRRAMERHLLRLRVSFADFVRSELRRRKAAANLQSFDDLVHGLAEALERPDSGEVLAAAIRARFPVALIDEFQDTDPAQYAIFERVYGNGGGTRLLVGDPKQAIYTFRGADVYAYLAARGCAAAGPFRLRTNYRAAPELVRAVNVLFSAHPDPFGTEIRFTCSDAAREAGSFGPPGQVPAPLRIVFIRREAGNGDIAKKHADDRVTRPVAAEIARLLGAGLELEGRPLAPGDIAVLCRTNEQAREMRAALRQRGVPSVLQSAGSVFATEEATEVQRVLAALASPGSGPAVRAALATDLVGLDAQELLRLEQHPTEWDAWLGRWRGWHDLWLRRGFLPAFRRMLEESGAYARLLALGDGERRLTNVLHLGELLHQAATQEAAGPEQLEEWLRQMRLDPAAAGDVAGEAAQLRLESDEDAVKLVTIHRSKGLEYPVVFCPYLWDGNIWRGEDGIAPFFHDADGALTVDLGSPEREEHSEKAWAENMAESVRLLYVALTRAREHCTVVWGAFRGAATSPLARVLHGIREGGPGQKPALPADEVLLADLHRLAAKAGGAIEIGEFSATPPPEYVRPGTPPRPLAARELARPVRLVRRVSSFSELAAVPRSEAAELGRDHDSGAPVAGAAVEPGAEGTVPLAAFPGGTRAGEMLHRILERVDFATATAADLALLARQALAGEGVDPAWETPLVDALLGVLEAPLAPADGGAPFRLRMIPAASCLREMAFVFPAGGAPAVTPARLAAVFERHGAPAADPAAGTALRELRFADLRGFLRGFIDLVFEREGRWYVLDWKSNNLGPMPEDYRAERLRQAMRQHHYYLQYHLYVLALHRHLARRLPGYEYARDFGGVFYVFLRGAGPAGPVNHGVFVDRPPAALVAGLSDLFAGAGA